MKKAIDGVWDFPKGHIKTEDTDELTTAIRELKEETGIDADKLNPVEGFFITYRKNLAKYHNLRYL